MSVDSSPAPTPHLGPSITLDITGMLEYYGRKTNAYLEGQSTQTSKRLIFRRSGRGMAGPGSYASPLYWKLKMQQDRGNRFSGLNTPVSQHGTGQ